MKIIIKCTSCGNEITLNPYGDGNLLDMRRSLTGNGFTLSTPDIDLSGNIEEIEDISEVEAEIRSIRIDCDNCDNYIELGDF